jgi:hypothetical protein
MSGPGGNTVRVQMDPIRSIAEASITSSYQALGTVLAQPVRAICITNNTDGDMFLSIDGTNNNMFIPKNSFRLYDICTNRQNADPGFYFGQNTQFFIKYSSAPSTGSVYLETIWGQ